MSERLPIYDSRIHLQHQGCVKLYFSGGHDRIISKKTFERSLYLYTKYAYELIDSKFNKMSRHKAEHKNFIDMNNKKLNVRFTSLVVVPFFILFGVNMIITCVRNDVYKSVVCGVISINVFAIICVLYVLYNKSVSNDNIRSAQHEAKEIKDILLSYLDVKSIAVDR